jgi:C1A family cysteine protease
MVATNAQKEFRHVRKATVLQDSTGEAIRVGGYRPDKKSRSSNKFGAERCPKHEMPEIVDLRTFMSPVENQRDSNSCTANAIAGAYEYLENRIYGQVTDVSRLFIYYNARALDDRTQHDEGTYLSHCVKVVRKYGACSEQTWPFELNQIKHEPPKQAYKEAKQFRIEDAAPVEVDLDAMRECLAAGYPFVFGLQLFGSFGNAGGNGGLVPMPDPNNESHDGGHAMLCVGYSDPDQVFIVRNSWGPEWGDQGYCYIPYAYMTNPELNHDCWVIYQVSDRKVDFRRDIHRPHPSLFRPDQAEIVRSLRIPGRTHTPSGVPLFNESYRFTYVEQLVYLRDCDQYVSIDAVEDLESLYYMEYEEEYEEYYEESWYEESEYLYEEESYEDEYDESSEEEEYENDTEDSYDDSEEEYDDEGEGEEEYDDESEIEDSYEDESDEGSDDEGDYADEGSYDEGGYDEGGDEGGYDEGGDEGGGYDEGGGDEGGYEE